MEWRRGLVMSVWEMLGRKDGEEAQLLLAERGGVLAVLAMLEPIPTDDPGNMGREVDEFDSDDWFVEDEGG